MLVYKLTDQNSRTFNNTQWGENVTHETNGEGDLCTKGWLHFYSSPELAILMNPIHADFANPKMWLAKAEGIFKDDFGRKSGCTKLTTLREIPVPVITETQKIAFGILCALEVCDDKEFQKWANNWLENKDRTKESANAAVYAVYATDTTHTAACAAANATNAAMCSADVSANTAYAVWYAVDVAISKNNPLDLQKIIEKALTY
jgi:hypothetical protein